MTQWEAKEKRVEDIISAAVTVFLEKGYEGASMATIAQRANISKGGLYHHFRSKDEILFCANEKLSEPVYLFIQDALNEPDAVQGLRSYIRSYIHYWINHQKELTFFFLTMTKALACPDMWGLFENYYNEIEGFLSGLFEKGIQQGSLVKHNSKASAVTLLAALDGVLVYLVMNRNLKPEEIIDLFETKYVNSLVSKK
jgi:AcrR family transcriptional regulator